MREKAGTGALAPAVEIAKAKVILPESEAAILQHQMAAENAVRE